MTTKRNFSRKINTKNENNIFYIFTEGDQTEKIYFELVKSDLRKTNIDIRVFGAGRQTLSLVDYAIRKAGEENIDVNNGDEVWVVFDTDTRNDVQAALQRADKYGIRCAVTNEAFELWLLLHFEYFNSDTGRAAYIKKLTAHLQTLTRKKSVAYLKNDREALRLIIENIEVAIKNAAKLQSTYSHPYAFDENCPSTNVHELITQLRNI